VHDKQGMRQGGAVLVGVGRAARWQSSGQGMRRFSMTEATRRNVSSQVRTKFESVGSKSGVNILFREIARLAPFQSNMLKVKQSRSVLNF
jgi:hypothetical protein